MGVPGGIAAGTSNDPKVTMRYMVRLLILVVAIVAGVALAADEENKSQATFQSVFGERARQVAATPDTRDDVEFAAELLKAVEQASPDQELAGYILLKASEYGMKNPAGYGTAITALTRLAEGSPRQRALAREKLVDAYQLAYAQGPAPLRAEAGAKMLDLLVELGDQKAQEGKTLPALALYRKAQITAANLRSRQDEVLARIKQMVARQETDRRLAELRSRLDKDADDTVVRGELIRLLVVEYNRPSEAATLLTSEVEDKLRTYVPLAAKEIKDVNPGVRLELAQWYRELSRKADGPGKVNALSRSADYCRSLVEGESGPAQQKQAEVLLEQVERDLEALEAAVRRPVAAMVYWSIADDMDVYLNGKALRDYRPDFRTRPDEAYQSFSAQVMLARGDVFTVGGRRGGSYGFVLAAVDKGGKVLWKTDRRTWQTYVPRDLAKWYLPAVARNSRIGPVQANASPWPQQLPLIQKYSTQAPGGRVEAIWADPRQQAAFFVSMVK